MHNIQVNTIGEKSARLRISKLIDDIDVKKLSVSYSGNLIWNKTTIMTDAALVMGCKSTSGISDYLFYFISIYYTQNSMMKNTWCVLNPMSDSLTKLINDTRYGLKRGGTFSSHVSSYHSEVSDIIRTLNNRYGSVRKSPVIAPSNDTLASSTQND